jgi:hypothetical protein
VLLSVALTDQPRGNSSLGPPTQPDSYRRLSAGVNATLMTLTAPGRSANRTNRALVSIFATKLGRTLNPEWQSIRCGRRPPVGGGWGLSQPTRSVGSARLLALVSAEDVVAAGLTLDGHVLA